MTDILQNNINISQQFSTSEYLKHFEKEISKSITLETLTRHFATDDNYYTDKPNIYRRKIKSTDKRFESFEIVYDNSETIHAVIFDLKITLSILQEIFGQPIMQNEPYSDTTAFAFKSTNTEIEIIKTRYAAWLKKGKGNDFIIEDTSNRIFDPEFSFVQVDIKR